MTQEKVRVGQIACRHLSLLDSSGGINVSILGWKSALKRALAVTAGAGMVAATLSTTSPTAQARTSDPT